MSGEMRQNVSKKEIKGGGEKKKRKRTCRKPLCGFFLVSQLLRCLALHCPGGSSPQFDVWSLHIFFKGCLDQNKFIFKLGSIPLKKKKREREEEEME